VTELTNERLEDPVHVIGPINQGETSTS
jgi:hypothetical protein